MSNFIINPYAFATGGGGGPSLPVSGALLWVRSDLGVYEDTGATDPAEPSDEIAVWQDQSGNGNHLTQFSTSGVRPSLDSGTTHLGRNTVRFTAAGIERMNIPDMFDGLSEAEVFATLKMVADPAASSASAGLWTLNNGSAFHTHHPWTDGVIYDNTFSTTRKTVGNVTPALTNWHVYSIRSASGDWEAYIDNTSVFSTGTNTVELPAGTSTLGMSANFSHFFDGWIAELVIYPFTLDSTQRGDVYDFLANG